jgi:branched-chain amino acid transport system ATP-binding protein
MNILSLSDISRNFGGLAALSRLSLSVEKGEILSLIGPNGAGKTTLLNIISGYYPPTMGQIFIEDINITQFPVHKRASLGLQRTFQDLQIFFNMTALENVMVGFYQRHKTNLFSTLLGFKKNRKHNREARARAGELMRKVGLGKWLDYDADRMPFGALKRLEIARALAANPKIILLDEPAAGLNPSETNDINTLIQEIADTGITVILVSHDMKMVMNISRRILVLNYGRKLALGPPSEIQSNPEVIEAYLGSDKTVQRYK